MKVQIKNCVTDPAYKELRRHGSPQFKPVILGQVLMPGATRVLQGESIDYALATKIDSLVKSGSLVCHIIGVGPVSLVDHIGFSKPVEAVQEAKVQVEAEDEVLEEPIEDAIEEDLAIEEAPIGGKSVYSEEELSSMKNSDLRSIALLLDESAQVNNKSKKSLVSLVLELQNV